MKDVMRIFSVLALVGIMLVLATTASAQTSASGYQDQAGQTQSGVDQGGGGPTSGGTVSSDTGGSLPFTGLDIALLAAAGGLFVLVGFGMRKLTRVPDSA
jgi:hypothetical protein